MPFPAPAEHQLPETLVELEKKSLKRASFSQIRIATELGRRYLLRQTVEAVYRGVAQPG